MERGVVEEAIGGGEVGGRTFGDGGDKEGPVGEEWRFCRVVWGRGRGNRREGEEEEEEESGEENE